MNGNSRRANIVKANRLLQAKAGTGEVKEEALIASQKVIDENDIDFAPLASEFLAKLETAIQEARKDDKDAQILLSNLITPIMEIKGNAAMFNYDLAGSLATIMLDFLEAVEELNPDVLKIVDIHHKTLSRIVTDKVTGDGGAFGQELTTELKQACKRYFAKHSDAGADIEVPDVFFVD